jgi:DNA-binding MarR family transcriptional regulator
MKTSGIKLGLEYRSAYRFAIISLQTTRSLTGLYRKHGLNSGGWRTLALIGNYEPIHPSRMAALTSVEPDKITRAVDRLVEKGLAVRTADKADRRRIVLHLTARGRRVYAEIERVRREVEARFLSVLSKDELASYYSILDKLESQARRLFLGTGALADLGEEKPAGTSRVRKAAARP